MLWSPGEIFSCCVLSGEGRERFGPCSVEGQNRLSSLSAVSCAHMPELRKNTQTLQMSNMRNPGSEGRHEHSLHFTCCKTCKTNYKLDVKLSSSIKLKLSSIQKSYAGPKFTLQFFSPSASSSSIDSLPLCRQIKSPINSPKRRPV